LIIKLANKRANKTAFHT